MSHDLVAVQRDAILLDALADRAWLDGAVDELDPVAGLLAALAADVDEGLLAGSVVAAPAAIPPQRRHADREATVLALPGRTTRPLPRRNAARAVAALVVTAALLSVSGVAAAVSGDPLTPYKRVIDVVRGEYDQVVPKGLVAPKPVVAPPADKVVAAKATAAVAQVRGEVGNRASRAADGRHFWNRHVGDRSGWDRAGWNRHGADRASRDSQVWRGRQQGGSEGGRHDSDRQHQGGFHDGSGSGRGGRDSGGDGDQWGDQRR
jgi:hypothetical protein